MNIEIQSPWGQFKSMWPNLLKLFIPAMLVLVAVLLARIVTDTEIVKFTRDPADIMGINPFYGAVSNIGVLVWCAAATCCFLAATTLDRQKKCRQSQGAQPSGRERNLHRFLFWSGMFTLLLMVDDLFMLHESLRDFLGIPEQLTFGLYGLLALSYLIRFGPTILATDYLLLLIGFGFLGLSMGLDSIQSVIQPLVPGYALVEDGFKLFGIVGWFGYFARLSVQTLILKDGS